MLSYHISIRRILAAHIIAVRTPALKKRSVPTGVGRVRIRPIDFPGGPLDLSLQLHLILPRRPQAQRLQRLGTPSWDVAEHPQFVGERVALAAGKVLRVHLPHRFS